MGQRHQVFLVFRGKCICALHHQWLCGRHAVKRLLRLLSYLQDYGVLRVIEYGDAYAPFTLAYSVDTKEGYTHYVDREPDLVDNPFGGDNNDGITIISLDDVGQRPKYCFMILYYNQFEGKVLARTPLTAMEYMRLYSDEQKHDSQTEAEIAELAAMTTEYELLRASDISEYWRHYARYFHERPDNMHNPAVAAITSTKDNPAGAMTCLSLADACVNVLLQAAAADPSLLAKAPWTVLLPIVSSAVSFSLTKSTISTPALINALSSLPADCRASFTEINLAGRKDVGDSELARVVELCPNIRRLDLSGTSVTNRSFSLLRGLSELLIVGCPVKHACDTEQDQGSWDTLAQQNPRLETLIHDYPYSKKTAPKTCQEDLNEEDEKAEGAPSPRAMHIYLACGNIFRSSNDEPIDYPEGVIPNLLEALSMEKCCQDREGARHFWLSGMRCVRMICSCLKLLRKGGIYLGGGHTRMDNVTSIDGSMSDAYFQRPVIVSELNKWGRREPSQKLSLSDQAYWAVLLSSVSFRSYYAYAESTHFAQYAFIRVEIESEESSRSFPEADEKERSDPAPIRVSIDGHKLRVRPVSVADYLEACYPSSADASWRAGMQQEEQEAIEKEKAELIKSMEQFASLSDKEILYLCTPREKRC